MELYGRDLLANRYQNKGTAFSADERDRLGLSGLLPPAIETLETQLQRVELEYRSKATDLGRHIFLRLLQERNAVLFYRFLIDHLAELFQLHPLAIEDALHAHQRPKLERYDSS